MGSWSKILRASIGVLLLISLFFFLRLLLKDEGEEVRAQLVGTSPPATGFARAYGPRPLSFPADHGPHNDFQTEWWYYTGNLETANGRRFGYQLTFFRRALVPPAQRQDRPSDWAAQQVYLAHFALTDVAGEQYYAFERFSRGAAGLAGAQALPYRVWLEDWSATLLDGVSETGKPVYRLQASQEGVAIDLELDDLKGPILQGDQGYSQKGPERGNASYYYSLTRLATSGLVTIRGKVFQVSGLGWMDHEYSTSALAPDQIGWDWFSLQLDDGSELMVFQIRKIDGSIDPFSSGTFIAPDGTTLNLRNEDFQIDVLNTWRSPHSGATYPAQWTLTVPRAAFSLNVTPLLADQELNVSYSYWEGAVRVNGQRAGQTVTGHGYVELTGYATSMQDQF